MSIPNGNDTTSTGGPIVRGVLDSELAIVLIGAILVGPGLLIGFAAAKWSELTSWCVDHHLLVPAGVDPIVTLPWSDGSGVDFWRLVLIIAVLAAVTFGGFWVRNALRRAMFERRARHGRA